VALRCLIIDDSEDFQASARRLLEAQGLEVVAGATSGAEAIRLVDELVPDIALVDVELGDEDGIALADELVARAPGLGVVLISSHDRAELSELLADSRAAGFLPKTDLGVEAICNLLGRAA
jgi:two-component system, NarL family, nitrate/nitrite response regulator NarL